MWAWDESCETQEEQDARYLRENPALECSLWSEWVCVVCGWEKIPNPTHDEWTELRKRFYSGKMPITSVDELKKMRERASQVNKPE